MLNVGIVTDSGANLSPKLIEENKIKVAPLKINLGGEIFLDGVDLGPGGFFTMLEESESIPEISPPSPLEFTEIFESMKNEGYESAVCILLSSNICHSFNSASEARDLVRPFPVVVIDSHAVSMSQGFMVIEAARAASRGLSTTEVVDRVWNLRPLVNFFGFSGTIHYLLRSGRLGKGAAFFRALLNIKPIISFDKNDGSIRPVGKVTSRREGLRYLVRKIEEKVSPGKTLHAAVLHGNEQEEAQEFFEEIRQKFDCTELYFHELSPIVSSQTGPGSVGVSFYAE
ncbi:MAG TPA: DegV family protein [Firmicutes bacterium]|nr:DegV family protein [Bacillota bacterium]